MQNCKICPFECGVDRAGFDGIAKIGVCGLPSKLLVSHYQQHFFEEPMISGNNDFCDSGSLVTRRGGSGAIFFTGCNGQCVFCQNYEISQKEMWSKRPLKELSEEGLFDICRELIDKGVHNINFVSPTPYTTLLCDFLKKYKARLGVPVVWNSNGYEKASTLRELSGLVDVYLPDLKYFDDSIAVEFSKMPKYFAWASEAVREMVSQVGEPKIGEDGFIQSGVVIRHLVLPGCVEDSKKILKWIMDEFGKDAYVALMAQYYPTYRAKNCSFGQLKRRLTADEYDEIGDYFLSLGFEDGLMQELSSAKEEYTPKF